jgi:hypothetical protein
MKASSPARSKSVATYVYAVMVGTRPRLLRPPRGLAGLGPLRAIDAGSGHWILASDAPLDRYSAAEIERGLRDVDWVSSRALRHESVIEHFMTPKAVVVPMKLFTLFSNDERAAAHVRKSRRAIDSIAARVQGCAEWGMRIYVDAKKLDRTSGRPLARLASGRAFLERKQARYEVEERVREVAVKAARTILAQAALHAHETKRRPIPPEARGGNVVLDAVFLVRHRDRIRFRKAVDASSKAARSNAVGVSLSGPWPPYHFVRGAK